MLDLQLVQSLQGGGSKNSRIVGRPGGCRIESGYDVASGRPARQLHHGVLSHFFRSNEFHLAERCNGFEFVLGEYAVLPDVDVNRFHRALQIGPAIGPVSEGFGEGQRLGAVVAGQRAPPTGHGPKRNSAPRNGRGGLDLHHGGNPRRSRHEEQQQGVGPRHRRLGEQGTRRLFLGMRVGKVETHSPGPAGSDLDVGPRARRACGFHDYLGVADELRHRERQHVLFHSLPRKLTLL